MKIIICETCEGNGEFLQESYYNREKNEMVTCEKCDGSGRRYVINNNFNMAFTEKNERVMIDFLSEIIQLARKRGIIK